MGNLAKEEMELPCPKCGRDIEVSYYTMYSRKEAKCSRCKSMYKFNSSDASNLNSCIRNFETAQDKFGKAIQRIIKGADREIKS